MIMRIKNDNIPDLTVINAEPLLQKVGVTIDQRRQKLSTYLSLLWVIA